MADERILRDLERKLEECLRDVRSLRGETPEGPRPRPKTGAELLAALQITVTEKRQPPTKWLLEYLIEYGPTRKSELLSIFANALQDGYETYGRCLGSMNQAVTLGTRGENPKIIALEPKSGRWCQVQYVEEPEFLAARQPKNLLLEMYSQPDQILGTPRDVGKPYKPTRA
jgi:hypothetical protein